MKRERMGRIDHELQRELARLISTELKDPRLGFVTVTRVEVTNDLHSAKVFVSIIGDRHVAKQSMIALEHAKGFLRGEIGHAARSNSAKSFPPPAQSPRLSYRPSPRQKSRRVPDRG